MIDGRKAQHDAVSHDGTNATQLCYLTARKLAKFRELGQKHDHGCDTHTQKKSNTSLLLLSCSHWSMTAAIC